LTACFTIILKIWSFRAKRIAVRHKSRALTEVIDSFRYSQAAGKAGIKSKSKAVSAQANCAGLIKPVMLSEAKHPIARGCSPGNGFEIKRPDPSFRSGRRRIGEQKITFYRRFLFADGNAKFITDSNGAQRRIRPHDERQCKFQAAFAAQPGPSHPRRTTSFSELWIASRGSLLNTCGADFPR
jgi:hypothetical protein